MTCQLTFYSFKSWRLQDFVSLVFVRVLLCLVFPEDTDCLVNPGYVLILASLIYC